MGHPVVQPGELRDSTRPLLEWVAAAGCSRAAIHFDVDTIDSNEIVLGLGAEPDGLTSAQVRRIVDDLDATVDIVGFTVAEFIPRQVIHLQQILKAFPLISGTTPGRRQLTAPDGHGSNGRSAGPSRQT